MNTNIITYFEIQSSNPPSEIKFYSNVFGWRFIKDESLPIEYYRITTDTLLGGLLKRPMAIPPKEFGTNAFTCSIQVDNFDLIAALIIQNGGTIALPKFAVTGKCWQGYFMDTDNNVFGIFQVDEKAI